MGMETFGLHGLILYVSEVFLFEKMLIHNVDMETFDPHGLILCESEGFLSEML